VSPIHDQSYRRYQGAKQPPGRAWTVILWNGVRGFLTRKVFLALLLVAWIPFIVRTVQIYVVTAYPVVGQTLPVAASTFQDFIQQQSAFIFFVTVFVGAGLIANDRRANALQIYLSKPLMRTEYIAGKLGVLMVFLLFITLLPAMLLLFVQVLFAGNFDFLRANLFVVPALVLASLMRVVVSSFTMLALSSLSKSTRYVAIMYAGAVFFTEAIYAVMMLITGSTRVAWVSIGGNIENLTDVMFRQPPRYETPVILSALVLLGLVVVSVSILERRVRGVEIVA
jgi:ABC-type transport system involved in multi-copper enzyme maturation permease subunit